MVGDFIICLLVFFNILINLLFIYFLCQKKRGPERGPKRGPKGGSRKEGSHFVYSILSHELKPDMKAT